MVNQIGAEFSNVRFYLHQVITHRIQFGNNYIIPIRLSIAMPAGDQRPGNNDHQDADGPDDFRQVAEILQLGLLVHPYADFPVLVDLGAQSRQINMDGFRRPYSGWLLMI